MPSRRSFLTQTAASTTLPVLAGRARAAMAASSPSGELAQRIALSHRRLTGPGFPAYSRRMVLADVQLDPEYPRLYSEFSGDVSGRYLEALTALPPPGGAAQIDELARDIVRAQRPDGRFGDAALAFTAADIGKPHMALLWGNGRLLVGLMTYAEARGDRAVLDAARRLGDFLVRVREQCSVPAVVKRLEGFGAHGFICFTQLIEGLVMLGGATKQRSYIDAARGIAPLLPPRGVQHTHGFLSTLRGIVMLHEATGEAQWLAAVEKQFSELLASPDHMAMGGVLEFFGAETPGLSAKDMRKLYDLDNKDPQDEGCSEADFVRLGLALWRVTGKREYLEAAEGCLYNQFFANQFHTGDFGHRVLFLHGFRASPQTGMAWWCCSMHGPRAMRDVRDAVTSVKDGVVRLDLFLDGTRGDGPLGLAVASHPAGDGAVATVTRAGAGEVALAIRQPRWASALAVTVNGKPTQTAATDGYVTVKRRWRTGDRVRVDLTPRTVVRTRDRRELAVDALGAEPVEGALFVGPWLLGVHEADDPLFFRRPWAFRTPHNDNVVTLPGTRGPASPLTREDAMRAPALVLRCAYTHGGWPEQGTVKLRPIAAQTAVPTPQTLATWMKFRRA